MHIVRRLADALRSPRRFSAFAGRALLLWRRGELGAAWQRARARSFSAADYAAWRRRPRSAAERDAQSTELQCAVIALLDADEAALQLTVQDLGSQTCGCREIFARDAGGGWRTIAVSSAAAMVDTEDMPLQDWLKKSARENAVPIWLLWITRAVRLEPDAIAVLVRAVVECPRARVVYSDDDVLDERGRPSRPRFKPAWDREQVLESNYVGSVVLLHGSLAAAVDRNDVRGEAALWRMLIEATCQWPPEAVVHVPSVLVHRRFGDAEAPLIAEASAPVIAAAQEAIAQRGSVAALVARGASSRWQYAVPPRDETVSIVIPTRDRPRLLRRCVESIAEYTRDTAFELVIVDDGSTDPEALQLLATLDERAGMRVVRSSGPFNFSRLCNLGVRAARGRIAVLLNNDTRIVEEGWLAELASLAARADIGAVGPLLLYEDGSIQAAGVFLGVNRTATNVLAGYGRDDPMARAWCATRRQVSAVAGACLAVERIKYFAVGGMDETFAVSHNELDLCLRLEAKGLANIFTPYARLIHVEGGTRGYEVTAPERARLRDEDIRFARRWPQVLARPDPAHNPNLARTGDSFALATSAAAPVPRAGWREGWHPHAFRGECGAV